MDEEGNVTLTLSELNDLALDAQRAIVGGILEAFQEAGEGLISHKYLILMMTKLDEEIQRGMVDPQGIE